MRRPSQNWRFIRDQPDRSIVITRIGHRERQDRSIVISGIGRVITRIGEIQGRVDGVVDIVLLHAPTRSEVT